MFKRRRSRREMEALAAIVVMGRPAHPTLADLVEGLNLARLDSFDTTPASMVLDRMGVRTADDLLRLLRLMSIDSAVTALEWARGSDDLDTDTAITTINGFVNTP